MRDHRTSLLALGRPGIVGVIQRLHALWRRRGHGVVPAPELNAVEDQRISNEGRGVHIERPEDREGSCAQPAILDLAVPGVQPLGIPMARSAIPIPMTVLPR